MYALDPVQADLIVDPDKPVIMEMVDQNIFLAVHSAGEATTGLWIFKIDYYENNVMVKQFQDLQVISGILDPDVGMVYTSSSGIFIDEGEAQ